MENMLEQFRLDSIAAIKPNGDSFQFDWEKLRYQYLEKMAVIDDELREKVFKELGQIQLALAEVSEENEKTALYRFGSVSKIILLCLKEAQDPLQELTKIADQYIQAYRKSKTGGMLHSFLSQIDEQKVASFYDNIIIIQREVYKNYLAENN